MANPPDEELIDRWDRRGRPRRRTVGRDEAHRLGYWHRTVHIWVSTGPGRILLQKRAFAKVSHPGKWDVSAAGHITAGDASILAAVRELREELGIVAAPGELAFLFTIKQRHEDRLKQFYDNEITDVYLLRRSIDIDSVIIDEKEVESVRTVTVRELRRELKEKPEILVGHGEEYERLFKLFERYSRKLLVAN